MTSSQSDVADEGPGSHEPELALRHARQEYLFAHFAGLALIPAVFGGREVAIAIVLGILVLDVLICRGYARATGTRVRSAAFAGRLARLLAVQAATIASIGLIGFLLLRAFFSW